MHDWGHILDATKYGFYGAMSAEIIKFEQSFDKGCRIRKPCQ